MPFLGETCYSLRNYTFTWLIIHLLIYSMFSGLCSCHINQKWWFLMTQGVVGIFSWHVFNRFIIINCCLVKPRLVLINENYTSRLGPLMLKSEQVCVLIELQSFLFKANTNYKVIQVFVYFFFRNQFLAHVSIGCLFLIFLKVKGNILIWKHKKESGWF